MTPKQRVRAAIRFENPDRLPMKHCCLPAALERPAVRKLLAAHPSDFAGEEFPLPVPPNYRLGRYRDEWGCVWEMLVDGMLGQVVGHPLAEDAAFECYPWPDPEAYDLSIDRDKADHRGDKYFVSEGLMLFERLIDLRGFENLMIDIAEENEQLEILIGNVLGYNLRVIERVLALNPDGVFLADDWGSQISMMISPAKWEKLFLPCYRQMFAKVRATGADVWFHTDGMTISILPQLVDAGAQVFWVDLTIHSLQELGARFFGKAAFLALPDTQFRMPSGTPAEVYAHTREMMLNLGRVDEFGKSPGGFIACACIEPGMPMENVEAMMMAYDDGRTKS